MACSAMAKQATLARTETPASVASANLGAGRVAMQVAAGASHTCALLDNGTVRCWGLNANGQLGYGNATTIGDNETPGSVGTVNLGVGRTAVAISAGGYHSCALLDNGTVRCWGQDAFGQTGESNPSSPDFTKIIPGEVAPVELGVDRTAVEISAGGYHTCALLDDGTVRCWGQNVDGQLGYGHTNTIGDNETPGSVGPVDLGGHTAIAIASGGYHTCALLDNGTVECSGLNSSGQLGYGKTANIGDNETPASVGTVSLAGEGQWQYFRQLPHLRPTRRWHGEVLGPGEQRTAGVREHEDDWRQRDPGCGGCARPRLRPWRDRNLGRRDPHLRPTRRWHRALLGQWRTWSIGIRQHQRHWR